MPCGLLDYIQPYTIHTYIHSHHTCVYADWCTGWSKGCRDSSWSLPDDWTCPTRPQHHSHCAGTGVYGQELISSYYSVYVEQCAGKFCWIVKVGENKTSEIW